MVGEVVEVVVGLIVVVVAIVVVVGFMTFFTQAEMLSSVLSIASRKHIPVYALVLAEATTKTISATQYFIEEIGKPIKKSQLY